MKRIMATVLIISIMLLQACNGKDEGNQSTPIISGLMQQNIDDKVKEPTDEGWRMDESGRFSYIEYIAADNKRPYVDAAIEYNDNYFMYRIFAFDEYIYGYMDKEFNILSEPISYAPTIFQNGFAMITGKSSNKMVDTEFNDVETYFGQYTFDGNNLIKVESRLVPEENPQLLEKSIDKLLIPVADNGATTIWEAGEGARWGYMSFGDVYLGTPGRAAEYIIKPIYDEARLFEEGLGAVCLDNKWGFIDEEGNMVIEPAYNEVTDFKYGSARVKIYEVIEGNGEARWALIDDEGNLLTDFIYSSIRDFKDGLFIAERMKTSMDGIKYQSYHYLSADGSERFPDIVSEIKGYKGDIPYVHWGKCIFYDMQGNRLFDEEYFLTSGFFEGHAAVLENHLSNRWGYIDLTGAMVIEDKFTFAGNFDNGYAFVKDSMSKSGFLIDTHGIPYLEELQISGITRFNDDGYALAYSDIITKKEVTDETGATYQIQDQKTINYMIHIEGNDNK